MVLKHGPWPELWKSRLLPLTTFTTTASDVFYGFPMQTTLPMLIYVSEPALHHICCHSFKKTARFFVYVAWMSDSHDQGRVQLRRRLLTPCRRCIHFWACAWATEHGPVQSPTYVNSRATQGLEAPPRTRRPGRASSPWAARESTYVGLWKRRTSTSHLARDPGNRPSAAQPWTELRMVTRPE